MRKQVIERIQAAKLWHIVIVSVIASEILTAFIVVGMALILHGEIRGDFMITGLVAAGFVSCVVSVVIVIFTDYIRESQEISRVERQEAEGLNARLAAALRQAGDAIFITDRDSNIIYVNPSFCQMTGFEPAEVLGHNANILKGGNLPEEFFSSLWGKINAGEVWSGSFTNRKKDGSLFEAKTTIAPIVDASGTITNYVSVMRDETREGMLKKAREYFTSVTSHELRTPLSKLQLAQIIADELHVLPVDEDKRAQMVQFLAGLYGELNRIVSATSLLSSLSFGEQKVQMAPTHICPAILHCINTARTALAQEGRDISLTADLRRLPETVKVLADHALLLRVIDETLSNAIKYSPDGQTVTVTGSHEGNTVIISIRDQGIGIPPDKLEQVFEPFFSIGNPIFHSSGHYKYKGGGIGLGFTVSRMIMESHGGRIKVESEGENRGTAVTLTFPAL